MSITDPNDLIGQLQSPAYWKQEAPAHSNRAYTRFEVRGDATILRIDAGRISEASVPIRLRDVSRGGIGFVAEQFIDPGTAWRLSFQHRGHVVGHQPVVIKFCRLVQDGLYLAGGQFTIEPAMMVLLGIDEHDLADDIRDTRNPLDTADFVAPDALGE